MTKQLFGRGVFMWAASERQTRRYGAFYPSRETFDGLTVEAQMDVNVVQPLVNKRVLVSCRVIESRPSGHAGDRLLDPNVFPSQPEVGEEILVGIGTLVIEPCEYSCSKVAIALIPSDGRKVFWCDPLELYRLHDQTVEFYIEETTLPDMPVTTVKDLGEGCVSNGDGTVQVIGRFPKRLKPKIENLGDGLFSVTPPCNAPAGEKIDVAEYQPDIKKTMRRW